MVKLKLDLWLINRTAEKEAKQTIVKAWRKDEDTLPKTNMDAQNDGSGKITPFKYGNLLVSLYIYIY